MSAVKLAAHPLVVAVAMGLLAPTALASMEDERKRRSADELVAELEAGEAPSDDDMARMEALWNNARSDLD